MSSTHGSSNILDLSKQRDGTEVSPPVAAEQIGGRRDLKPLLEKETEGGRQDIG